jgi:hypothetical protein
VTAADDQQLYGGTQSALSTTLLLLRSSAGADGAPIVENQHRWVAAVAAYERVATMGTPSGAASTRR